MTEDEAKTKICPTLMAGAIQAVCAAKASLTENGAEKELVARVTDDIYAQRLCHGSGCVMWEKQVLKPNEHGNHDSGDCGLKK